MVGLLGSWVEWLVEMEWRCRVVEAFLRAVLLLGTV